MKKEGMIAVPGGSVWYQRIDLNSDATPVIILHGGPGSSHYSMQGLSALAKERPVIFYDQLGCGKSDRPKDPELWKIERFVEELEEVRQSLSLEEVHILGHSWGTTLAAAYYLANPNGVKSIVFSSPCLSAPMWAKDQEKNRLFLPKHIQDTLKQCEESGNTDSTEYKEATAYFNKQFVCKLDPLPEFLLEGAHYRNREVYNVMWGPSEFFVTGNLKNFDCTNRLSEITIPTLFTCGRYDEATPDSTFFFSQLTPKSQFHVFENSAHMPYIEEKEEYLKVMTHFLASVD